MACLLLYEVFVFSLWRATEKCWTLKSFSHLVFQDMFDEWRCKHKTLTERYIFVTQYEFSEPKTNFRLTRWMSAGKLLESCTVLSQDGHHDLVKLAHVSIEIVFGQALQEDRSAHHRCWHHWWAILLKRNAQTRFEVTQLSNSCQIECISTLMNWPLSANLFQFQEIATKRMKSKRKFDGTKENISLVKLFVAKHMAKHSISISRFVALKRFWFVEFHLKLLQHKLPAITNVKDAEWFHVWRAATRNNSIVKSEFTILEFMMLEMKASKTLTQISVGESVRNLTIYNTSRAHKAFEIHKLNYRRLVG